jgi:hypothetical protein
MARFMGVLVLVCTATVPPLPGCGDDSTTTDDGASDDARIDDSGADADADADGNTDADGDADADADADGDDAGEGDVEPDGDGGDDGDAADVADVPDSDIPAPSATWAVSFGSTVSFDDPYDLDTDGAGNLVAVGNLDASEAVDFGGGPVPGSVAGDLFMASYSADGAFRWARRFPRYGSYLDFVEEAPGGGFVVGGELGGAIDLGGGPLRVPVGFGVFLASFDSAGVFRWARQFDGAFPRSMEIDSAGNLLVAGGFNGTVNFGGEDLVGGITQNGFVVSLGPDGSHRWSVRIPQGYVRAVPIPGGGAFLSATCRGSGTIDLGGGPIACPGWDDTVIGGLDSSGGYLWARRLGGSSEADQCAGFVRAVDAAGNAVLCGSYAGTVDLGDGPVGSGGEMKMFLETTTADGTYRWSHDYAPAIHGGAPPECLSAALDPSGNLVLGGYFSGSTDLGGGPITSTATVGGLLASFTIDGAHRWSRGLGASTSVMTTAVLALPDGSVAVLGTFRDTANIDGHELTSHGEKDIFIALFAD